jgi:hypothetical protein
MFSFMHTATFFVTVVHAISAANAAESKAIRSIPTTTIASIETRSVSSNIAINRDIASHDGIARGISIASIGSRSAIPNIAIS